jgi:isocitrate lyase
VDPLNVFELTKKFIRAGAAGVHFEDQLASEKKCGHMGGKVLGPTGTMVKNFKVSKTCSRYC